MNGRSFQRLFYCIVLLMPLTGNFTLAVERKVPVVASPSMKVICTVQNVLHLYFKIYFYYFSTFMYLFI